MFALSPSELAAEGILDCPAGASSFGAQVRSRGGTVTSVDPVYAEAAEEVLALVGDNLAHAPEWLAAYSDTIDWSYLGSSDAHIRASQLAAELFAGDFATHSQHYVAAALPQLPFPDGHFTLTLSGNFLFVNQYLGYDEHVDALRELVRVTRGEVRVHPIVDLAGAVHPRLEHLCTALKTQRIDTEVRPIDRGWLRGGNYTLICRSIR